MTTAGNDEIELTKQLGSSSVVAKPIPPKKQVPLTEWQKFRRFIRLRVVQSVWFDFLVLFIITINCVFLALENPKNGPELKKYNL